MKKYIERQKVVSAAQFLLESTHPSFGEPKPISVPPGVERRKFSDYQDPAPYYKWVIETTPGLVETVMHGDWIVKHADSTIEIMKPKEFREKYIDANFAT